MCSGVRSMFSCEVMFYVSFVYMCLLCIFMHICILGIILCMCVQVFIRRASIVTKIHACMFVSNMYEHA